MSDLSVLEFTLPFKDKFENLGNIFVGLHKDAKRPVFRGTKVGLFFISKSFQRVYIKDESFIEKIEKDIINSSEDDSKKFKDENEPQILGSFRLKKNSKTVEIFVGPRGGKFYLNSNGTKCYIKNFDLFRTDSFESKKFEDDRKTSSNIDKKEEDSNSSFDDTIQKIIDLYRIEDGYRFIGLFKIKGSANGRASFEGPNGGKFYVNSKGNKSYF
ncbi:unnamed protein product [Brachionus calyciflorus]|uniref:Uncharacterized protein n=1 Tax=Brachionus calyciflorus TaxID=104777 RepID=A0A814G9E4_9BILA|nr:unnamed protein product [Brachionus calyciflorus]